MIRNVERERGKVSKDEMQNKNFFSLQRGGVREEEVEVEGPTDKFFVSSLYFHSPLFSLHSLSPRSITC
jgi:hypothetical protein